MPDTEFEPAPLLFLAWIGALAGLSIAGYLRRRRDGRIGRTLFFEGDSSGLKPVLFAAQAALLLLVVLNNDLPRAPAIGALVTAFLMTLLTPGARDQVLGEEGVSSGFSSSRHEDLEEWRLTGDHLRFKLRDEWTAVTVPRERREGLQARLRELVPERESTYRD